MSRASDAVVLKPKSVFDRQLARIEQQAVWEHTAESVRTNWYAAEWLFELSREAYSLSIPSEGHIPTPSQRLRALSVAGDLASRAATIRKETILDRTIPALSRIEAATLIATLPPAADELEATANPDEDPVIAHRNAVHAELRGLRERRAIALVEADDA